MKFTCLPCCSPQRLDHFLYQVLPQYSHAQVRQLLQAGGVRVGGRIAHKGDELHGGEEILMAQLPQGTKTATPEPDPSLIPKVVYEDKVLLIVTKPAVMPTHPLLSDEQGTLVNGLLAGWPGLAGVGFSPLEPGILHRLDRDTSGLVLVAKDQATFKCLRAQFKKGEVIKTYQAVVAGRLQQEGEQTIYLASSPNPQRVRASLDPGPELKPFITRLGILERRDDTTLVEATITKAFRHHIRAHLTALGHPVVGDKIYGHPDLSSGRHWLHACRLEFTHPVSGQRLVVTERLEFPTTPAALPPPCS